MPAKRKELLDLLEKLSVPVSRSFLDAVSKITSRAQIKQLIALIDSGDINAILKAAGVRDGSWSALTESVRNAYVESGVFVMAADVPRKYGAIFNISNPRAEQWLRNNSSSLITRLTNEQVEIVRLILQDGMMAGRNPRVAALDIVGRISKRTGRRSGGIIGLNGPQARAVTNARVDLESLSERYFTRKMRDRRFDSTVRKAIEAGTPLDSKTINKLVGRYADRLLKLRGDTVGRTEVLRALNAASDESLRQVVDQGLAPPDAITRIWKHSFAGNERPGHLAMNNQERGLEEPFNNPETNAVLQYPGDGSAAESANCRCIVEHKIDFIAVELAA